MRTIIKAAAAAVKGVGGDCSRMQWQCTAAGQWPLSFAAAAAAARADERENVRERPLRKTAMAY